MSQLKTVREQLNDFFQDAVDGQLPFHPDMPQGDKRHPSLNADLLKLYTPHMEVQINVETSKGTPVEDRRNTWERDGQTYWHIRIPKKAMSIPEWDDYPLRWPLAKHAEGIGLTGWDFGNLQSRWVAFDFDAITGHSPGIGVTDEQLQAIREAAFDIPYVQVRRSTRGGGYHLYVYFSEWQVLNDECTWATDGVPCENHAIHSALARCILAKMSQEANFNFASAIDTCGGNMWVWHRDANEHNGGLSIIKDHTEIFDPDALPPNWRDHVDVVTRKRTKIKIRGIAEAHDADFDAMVSGRNVIPLDDIHNKTIERIGNAGYTTIWVPEYNLLQTHTCGLAHILEEFRDEYNGFFETLSQGDVPGQSNCFAFPLPHGGWRVIRFSKGIREHGTWEQDGRGWTSTYFNCRPNLETAAISMGGAELGSGGFQFETVLEARKAIMSLGVRLEIDESWDGVKCQFKRTKNSRLMVLVERIKDKSSPGPGWVGEKRNWWYKVYKVDTDSDDMTKYEYPEFDSIVRVLVTPGNENAGWVVKSGHQDKWDLQPITHVKLVLQGPPFNMSRSETEAIMGSTIYRRWNLVNMPFQPEFPGNRQWNFNAPQLRYAPAIFDGDSGPHHPHWDMVLDHIGQDLNEALPGHLWASRHGIRTGRQYLQLWITSMIREPFEPLPYLFLWGPENSGKSIIHEAVGKLIIGGIAYADKALTTTSEFNGELANAVLAVVEETNVSKAGERARNRMKDWVTSEYLSIRRMRTDAYLQKNTLHFIQCSNSPQACLVRSGDTRTTVLYVPALCGEEIPKSVLKRELEKEASHFMATIMDVQIPPVEGRLRIPFINTAGKEQMEQQNLNPLEAFIDENAENVRGAIIKFSDFYKMFQNWLSGEEEGQWTRRRVTGTLPARIYPTGKYGGNGETYIGNIAWNTNIPEESEELVLHNRRLRPKSQCTRGIEDED